MPKRKPMIISNIPGATPLSFLGKGLVAEHLILICDVDGVIRKGTDEEVDPRVVKAMKTLVKERNADIVFISGTPIVQDPALEIWKRGNLTLDKALGKFFTQELSDKKVTIYGALGGQRMTHDGQVEILEQYPLEMNFELGQLLLLAFLGEVEQEGTLQQKRIAADTKDYLYKLKLIDKEQPAEATPDEFRGVVDIIRSHLDTTFRLVSDGPFIESHTSSPPWGFARSLKWLKSQLDSPHLLISQLPEEQKQLAAGLAHRGNESFNFLMISKTNKGCTIKKYLQEKLIAYPNALVVTIGDTQVDFPMHQHAHLAYHVGLEQVWKDHALPHCLLVKDADGRDCQHVNGTLHLLDYFLKLSNQ